MDISQITGWAEPRVFLPLAGCAALLGGMRHVKDGINRLVDVTCSSLSAATITLTVTLVLGRNNLTLTICGTAASLVVGAVEGIRRHRNLQGNVTRLIDSDQNDQLEVTSNRSRSCLDCITRPLVRFRKFCLENTPSWLQRTGNSLLLLLYNVLCCNGTAYMGYALVFWMFSQYPSLQLSHLLLPLCIGTTAGTLGTIVVLCKEEVAEVAQAIINKSLIVANSSIYAMYFFNLLILIFYYHKNSDVATLQDFLITVPLSLAAGICYQLEFPSSPLPTFSEFWDTHVRPCIRSCIRRLCYCLRSEYSVELNQIPSGGDLEAVAPGIAAALRAIDIRHAEVDATAEESRRLLEKKPPSADQPVFPFFDSRRAGSKTPSPSVDRDASLAGAATAPYATSCPR